MTLACTSVAQAVAPTYVSQAISFTGVSGTVTATFSSTPANGNSIQVLVGYNENGGCAGGCTFTSCSLGATAFSLGGTSSNYTDGTWSMGWAYFYGLGDGTNKIVTCITNDTTGLNLQMLAQNWSGVSGSGSVSWFSCATSTCSVTAPHSTIGSGNGGMALLDSFNASAQACGTSWTVVSGYGCHGTDSSSNNVSSTSNTSVESFGIVTVPSGAAVVPGGPGKPAPYVGAYDPLFELLIREV